MTTAEWMLTNKIDRWILKNEPKKVYIKPTIKPRAISIVECIACGTFCDEARAVYGMCPGCANEIDYDTRY